MYIEYIERLIDEASKSIEEREYNTAKDLMNQGLYEEPDYAKLHNNLGWLYQYCIKDKKQAELHLSYAIKFDPKFEASYINLADLYLEHKEYVQLREVMQKVLDQDGSNKAICYENIGKAYEGTCEFSKAIKNYKMAMYETIDSYDADELKQAIKRCKYKRIKKLF